MTEKVLLGRILDAHGLKGEVKVASYTARPDDIAAYGSLSSQDGTKRYQLHAIRPLKASTIIARVKGVTTRDAAEKLRGIDLYAGREKLPPPDEGEFYHSDLIGLKATNPGGELIGEVTAVHNFGAGDMIEVRLEGASRTELVPFDNAHIPHVDLAARSLVIAAFLPDRDETSNEPPSP